MNEVIDNHSNGGVCSPHLIRQICPGNAFIREADQIRCGVLVKIPNILVDRKPVGGRQRFTSEGLSA